MGYLRFLRANAPFLAAGFLLTLGSSYGQTYFISIFADEIMTSFRLSDGQWGLTYTLATTLSAAVMVWAGGLADRFRVRRLVLFVMPALALACVGMATVGSVAGLVAVVFALRLFGQGMMSHLAVVAMARWFVATRGRALSIAALGFAGGQALFPVMFAALMLRYDWRSLWFLAAAMLLVTLPVVLRLLRAERTPQSIARQTQAVGLDGRHWTRGEVLRHWLFWLSVPMMLGPPAWGTALFFQQVHFAQVKGWPLVDYLALLPLYTAVSVAVSFASGALIDRIGTARLAQLYLLPFALAFVVLSQVQTLSGAALGLSLVAIGTGIQATLPAAYWAEFFGTRHIGAIKALATAIMVLGSAIGPGVTGVLIDLGYDFPRQMLGIAAYFVFAAALVTIGTRAAARRLPAAA